MWLSTVAEHGLHGMSACWAKQLDERPLLIERGTLSDCIECFAVPGGCEQGKYGGRAAPNEQAGHAIAEPAGRFLNRQCRQAPMPPVLVLITVVPDQAHPV